MNFNDKVVLDHNTEKLYDINNKFRSGLEILWKNMTTGYRVKSKNWMLYFHM